jgi:hypothetical protein
MGQPRRGRTILPVGIAALVAACSRGPAPPQASEDLRATVVGVIAVTTSAPPVVLTSGGRFAPPAGAKVSRIENWPARETDEPVGILQDLLLLLGGQRADGSWWYELAGFSRAWAGRMLADCGGLVRRWGERPLVLRLTAGEGAGIRRAGSGLS